MNNSSALQILRTKSIWYHGTFTESYENIKARGIDVTRGIDFRRKLDFGPGFYLTSNKIQAERFIIGKQKNFPFNASKTPCVIEYKIDINDLIAEFKGHFLFNFDKEFADFVSMNREKEGLLHNYDFVYGKVADGRKLVEATDRYRRKELSLRRYLREIGNNRYATDDQLSIHNKRISDILIETDMQIIERS